MADAVKEEVLIKVGARVIDITRMPPITGRDKLVLLKDHQLDVKDFQKFTTEQEAKFGWFALHKVDETVTWDEALDMPWAELSRAVVHYLKCSTEVDRPTSMPSTPLGGTTVGTP